ncbi:MAG: DUF4249 family protein [Bacteroidetes bacterium]|nr:DUF4249 family protein [Fibrella sp.]
MKQIPLLYGLALLAGAGLAACQQDIDVTLPPYTSKLVLECYLEDCQPVRLSLLESRSYLDISGLPLVDSALVVLSHRGRNDTIPNVPFVDRVTRKSYNYSSPVRIKADDDSPYTLTVRDKSGRTLTATTQFIRPVAIKSLSPEFNSSGKAYCLTTFDDNPRQRNYYRLTQTRNRRVDTLTTDALLDDSFSDGEEINWGSGYDYVPGDTIHATLYHCTEAYYKFLTTAQSARRANTNPFAASGEVISNVQGGLGVFATLTYSYRWVVVR